MEISTGYSFYSELEHQLVNSELPEVVHLRWDADFAEEQGAGHVYLSFMVEDSGVSAGRGYLFDDAFESSNGGGLVGKLVTLDC